MIQIIGLMIGSYIVVRMLSFTLRTGDHKESIFVQVVSVLNLIFTIMLMAFLLASPAPGDLGR